MTTFRALTVGALLLLAGGCDRYGDGLTGTPPPGDTTLTFVGGSYDLSLFPDVSINFTLNSDSGPVDNLQLGDLAVITKEYAVEISTSLGVTGSVIRGPSPVVVTQIIKDPAILGTYTIFFRTKASNYWSFNLAFDYGGLREEVYSDLNYNGTSTGFPPPATPGGATVVSASSSPGGGG